MNSPATGQTTSSLTSSHSFKQHSGVISLVMAVLIFSTMPALLKYLSKHLDLWTLVSLRQIISACFWLPFLLRFLSQKRLEAKQLPRFLILGAIYALGHILWNAAVFTNQVSVLIFVGRMIFLWSTIFGFIFIVSERVLMRKPLFWSAFGCCLLGLGMMYIAVRRGEAEGIVGGGGHPYGIPIMLACTLCWGAYGVALKRLFPRIHPAVGFSALNWVTIPVFIALLFSLGDPSKLTQLSAELWIVLILFSITSSGLGHFFAFLSIQKIGPVITEGVFNVIPFITTAIAAATLGERMNPLQWGAGLTIFTGSCLLFILLLQRKRERAAALP